MPPKSKKVFRKPGRRQQPRVRRRNNATQHMTSEVIGTITLKSKHKKEEVYPLPLDTIISRANIGADADIRAVGYTIQFTLATGNKTETVTSSLGHSGPWIRRGTSTDTFNQQFMEHTFRDNTVLFRKKLLHESEREFINPDVPANSIDLRVRDPCGVIPGVVVRYQVRFHLIRPTPKAEFLAADEDATDRYEDQDVNGTAIIPPNASSDIPVVLTSSLIRYITTDTASPYTYTSQATSVSYTITVSGSNINKVGEFLLPGSSTLQQRYTDDGFSGNIAKN